MDWNSGYSVSASDFQSLDTTQILAPRAADGSLPEGTCLHLADGSSLINAGIDVNLWYNDFAPDLGCYETPGERHDPEPGGDDTIPAVQPEGTHAVAFVTIPKSPEDKALLHYLRQNDSLWVVETDATNAEVDYSTYEVIVLGSKPNSGAAGFRVLKGYDKPMVLLKPFLLKSGVWDWGTAANTQDLGISVSHPEHALFSGLTISAISLALEVMKLMRLPSAEYWLKAVPSSVTNSSVRLFRNPATPPSRTSPPARTATERSCPSD